MLLKREVSVAHLDNGMALYIPELLGVIQGILGDTAFT